MGLLRFTSLGSGSQGNGTIVQSDSTTLLVDCGWSKRETVSRLKRRSIDPAQIDAILVTHRHGDHSRGVDVFSRGYAVPVYCSVGTQEGRNGKVLVEPESHLIARGGSPFLIGDIEVSPIQVPHDCSEPLQYVFEHDGKRFGLLTDVGHISLEVHEGYQNCQTLFVESNHDVNMLWKGSYPIHLKHRISGPFGHLSNRQTLDFIEGVYHDELVQVIVGHISQENNDEDVLDREYENLRTRIQVSYATQEEGTDWIEVGAGL